MVTAACDRKQGEGEGEGEGEGGEIVVEEKNINNFSNQSDQLQRNQMGVVEDLIGVIESVDNFREYRKIQKKESHNLVRRLKFFLPLLEEIRDQNRPIREKGVECLKKLHKAFRSARRLLRTCHCGSKIYLALENEAIVVKFHTVYDKIVQALDGLPYDDLGISAEERVEVELIREQMRKAKKRIDTQDMELVMDLMVVLSNGNDRNADSASIERLANKLGLRTAEELKVETIAVKKLTKGGRGPSAESTQQIINLLNKFKRLAGVPENDQPEEPVATKALNKSVSLAIPPDFLCPITLEIMRDPVIVATGQSYERESIQHWIDTDHRTCPKTGQVLSHLNLAPNVALRNLILQWCEKNNYQLPEKEKPAGNNTSSNEEEILSLIQNLSTNQLQVQRQAVTKIRMLSKESPESTVLIVDNGGIPPLVELLSYPDSKIQEHAVTALLNLSIDEPNKKLISREQPIPAIIEVLQTGNIGAKENSAAALFSLSMLDENKETIGSLNGIPPLVDLLRDGTIRGKKDAVTALFNLSLNHENKARAIEAGIVAPLLKVIGDKRLDMVNEILSLLLLLISNTEALREIGQLSFVETLVNLMKEGTPKNKECAAAVLFELGCRNSNLMLAALQYGVYDPIIEIAKTGTDRGQRKANAILQLMSKTEQI